jgi:hypothetical protein
MKLTGIIMSLFECEMEDEAAFNRWYDLDHIPEGIAMPEILWANRFIATPDLKAMRLPSEPQLIDPAKATYCTIYWCGVDDVARAQAAMAASARDLFKREGRMIQPFSDVQLYEVCRLTGTYVRQDVAIHPDGVPYLGHRAIIVGVGELLDEARRDEVEDWYRDSHYPDMVATPGVLAALRFTPIEPRSPQRWVQVLLLDGEPSEVIPALRTGLPARDASMPTGAFRVAYSAAYRPITPLKYDFLE